MGESSAGAIAQIDARSSALGKLMMSGDKIGVQMRFKYVLDRDVMVRGSFQIDINVTLWINNHCLAFRRQHVGGMRQASQIELFEVHRDSQDPRKKMLDEIGGQCHGPSWFPQRT